MNINENMDKKPPLPVRRTESANENKVSKLYVGPLSPKPQRSEFIPKTNLGGDPYPQPSLFTGRLSDNAYQLLQEQRKKITLGGRYQDRYKNEFVSFEKRIEDYQINNQDDLKSFKLVQNISRTPPVVRKNEQDVPKIEPGRKTEPALPKIELTGCIDTRPLLPVNLKANFVPRSQTPNFELNKEHTEEKTASIDVLSAIQANINIIEANIKAKENVEQSNTYVLKLKNNLYSEQENLLKPGISDLTSEPTEFAGLNKVRNSTGGVEQLKPEKPLDNKIKLNRTVSDTQDRPITRLVRKHGQNNRILQVKWF